MAALLEKASAEGEQIEAARMAADRWLRAAPGDADDGLAALRSVVRAEGKLMSRTEGGAAGVEGGSSSPEAVIAVLRELCGRQPRLCDLCGSGMVEEVRVMERHTDHAVARLARRVADQWRATASRAIPSLPSGCCLAAGYADSLAPSAPPSLLSPMGCDPRSAAAPWPTYLARGAWLG